jgi:hypothetical protein
MRHATPGDAPRTFRGARRQYRTETKQQQRARRNHSGRNRRWSEAAHAISAERARASAVAQSHLLELLPFGARLRHGLRASEVDEVDLRATGSDTVATRCAMAHVARQARARTHLRAHERGHTHACTSHIAGTCAPIHTHTHTHTRARMHNTHRDSPCLRQTAPARGAPDRIGSRRRTTNGCIARCCNDQRLPLQDVATTNGCRCKMLQRPTAALQDVATTNGCRCKMLQRPTAAVARCCNDQRLPLQDVATTNGCVARCCNDQRLPLQDVATRSHRSLPPPCTTSTCVSVIESTCKGAWRFSVAARHLASRRFVRRCARHEARHRDRSSRRT